MRILVWLVVLGLAGLLLRSVYCFFTHRAPGWRPRVEWCEGFVEGKIKYEDDLCDLLCRSKEEKEEIKKRYLWICVELLKSSPLK